MFAGISLSECMQYALLCTWACGGFRTTGDAVRLESIISYSGSASYETTAAGLCSFGNLAWQVLLSRATKRLHTQQHDHHTLLILRVTTRTVPTGGTELKTPFLTSLPNRSLLNLAPTMGPFLFSLQVGHAIVGRGIFGPNSYFWSAVMNRQTQRQNWILTVCGRPTRAALISAVVLICTSIFASAQAQTYSYSTLYEFVGSPNGLYPEQGLVLDAKGNLYGTTDLGGPSVDLGYGTVFKLDSNGNETLLTSFDSTTGYGEPLGSPAMDAQGNLYGSTQNGAASGEGAAFKVDSAGNLTVLYNFTSSTAFPSALIRDKAGNLYGTSYEGGASEQGTVFKLDPANNLTVLYNFTGFSDGGSPNAGLVRDAQGNLYGDTRYGGNGTGGTVFKVDPSGNETVLHSFGRAGDGALPNASLIQDAQGNLYGTTFSGGADSYGTVFEVDAAGEETVLYTFTGGSDGSYPYASLVRDAHGNLYSTTYSGGTFEQGTVFELSPDGHETVLYSFTGGLGGGHPLVGLAMDANGALYGTTSLGGVSTCDAGQGCGIVFKLTPQVPTSTTLTSSPNPSNHGQAVTFTATVASNHGASPDGESVTFRRGDTVLGTGTLTGGSASFTTSSLPVGTHGIRATYAGDSSFATSTSKSITQVVNQAN